MLRSKITVGMGITLLVVLALGAGLLIWKMNWFAGPTTQKVESLIQEKKWGEAESLLTYSGQSIEMDTRQILLARIRIGQGRPEGALNALEKISQENRKSFEARIIAGRALLLMGNASKALELFDLAQQEKPADPEANRGLAGALYDLGALDQSFRILSTHIKDHPDGLSLRFAGQIAREMGRKEDACEYLEKALTFRWETDLKQEIALDLLEVQLDRNELIKSRKTWDDFVLGFPPSARRSALGGRLNLYEGKLGEAAVLLDEARKLDPGSATIARLRGQVWLEQDKPEEAVPLLDFATLEDPLDTVAWNQKALALERLGRKDGAKEARMGLEEATANLKKMTELNEKANNTPSDVQSRLELSRLCLKVKRPKLAEIWEKAAQEASRIVAGPGAREPRFNDNGAKSK